MCPMEAFTSKPGPRYFPMVFALAGDSTMTKFVFAMFLNYSIFNLTAARNRLPLSSAAYPWICSTVRADSTSPRH